MIAPRARVLRYGQSIRFPDIVCKSRASGLTCTNKRGHGWTLAREKQRIF